MDLPNEVGDFELRVDDDETKMYVSNNTGYEFVMITRHGDRYKVQWGEENRDEMIYVFPGDEVIADSDVIYKENPKELVTEKDREVTYSVQKDAIEAALTFIRSFAD